MGEWLLGVQSYCIIAGFESISRDRSLIYRRTLRSDRDQFTEEAQSDNSVSIIANHRPSRPPEIDRSAGFDAEDSRFGPSDKG
jgi:hypothetical protein